MNVANSGGPELDVIDIQLSAVERYDEAGLGFRLHIRGGGDLFFALTEPQAASLAGEINARLKGASPPFSWSPTGRTNRPSFM